MPVAIPAAVDANTVNPANKDRQVIGAPSTGQKTQGNIPPNLSASQWNVGNGTTEGNTINFDLANGASSSAVTFDASTDAKIVVCSWQFNAPNRIELDTLANGGIEFRLVSGTGNSNYRSYYICGQDTRAGFYQPGVAPFVIDMSVTANHPSDPADTGTYDDSDVQAWGWIITSANNGGSTHLGFLQRLHVFDTALDSADIVKFTGTSDFDDLVDAVLGTSAQGADAIGGWVSVLGSAIFVPIAFQIGDSSTATNFNDNGATIITPGDAETNDPRFRLSTQANRVYVRLRNNAADTVVLTGTYVWGTAAPWDLDFDNLGTVTIDGAVFNGMGNFTAGGSVTGAATFNLDSGAQTIINGADLDGSTFNGNVRLDTDTDLADMVINGNLRINIASDATLNFSNVTITGDIVNIGAGNITINKSGGNTYTEGSHTGGTVTIVANSLVTLTGVPNGATVYVFSAQGVTPALGSESNITDGDYTLLVDQAEGTVFYSVVDLDDLVIQGTLDVSGGDVTQALAPTGDRQYENP